MRDYKTHQIGLGSDRYPTATFTSSAPVSFTKSTVAGHVKRTPVTGMLTIHGTTRSEVLPVEFTPVRIDTRGRELDHASVE